MKILIAEDDQDSGENLGELLCLLGHAARWTRDGRQALEALADEHFDAVLLDIVMPRVNGLEFLSEARRRGILNCPVVVVTGNDPDWASDISSVDYILTKPLSEEPLRQILNEIASRPKGESGDH